MKTQKNLRGMASTLVVLAALFIIPFFFASCTSDYDFEEAFVPEKIFIRDTVHVHTTDTIIKEVEKTKIEYVDRPVYVTDTLIQVITKTDTLVVTKTERDTITITEEIIKEVPVIQHDTIYQYIPVEVPVYVTDTVVVEKIVYVEKEVIKYVDRTDTVTVVVHDTVYVETPVNPDPVLPDTPEEWGTIDWELTQAFGGISWTFDNNMQPTLNASVITSRGIVSFNSGNAYFYSYDTSKLSGRLSAIPTGSAWTPSYINVKKNPNYFWEYAGLSGVTYNMNGVEILKTVDVELERPFMTTGDAYQFDEETGYMNIVYTYKDRADETKTVTLFEGYFRK